MALTLATVMLIAGCGVLNSIATYLPIFSAALNGVIALVAPGSSTAIATDEAKAQSALAAVQAAVAAYNAAPAASKATEAQAIATALGAVEPAAAAIEQDLALTGQAGKDAQLAVAILDLSIGTFQAIVTAVESAKPAPATAIVTPYPEDQPIIRSILANWDAYGQQASVPVKARPAATSPTDFKRKYNALVQGSGHPEMAMKLSLAEKLHLKR